MPPNSGTLPLTLAGDNGEAHPFAGAPGRPVSLGHDECASLSGGSNDACTSCHPAPGRYSVLVHDGCEGDASARLTAVHTPGRYEGPPATAPSRRQPLTLSGRKGAEQRYEIDVPAGTARLLATTGGAGRHGRHAGRAVPASRGEPATRARSWIAAHAVRTAAAASHFDH